MQTLQLVDQKLTSTGLAISRRFSTSPCNVLNCTSGAGSPISVESLRQLRSDIVISITKMVNLIEHTRTAEALLESSANDTESWVTTCTCRELSVVGSSFSSGLRGLADIFPIGVRSTARCRTHAWRAWADACVVATGRFA